MSVCTHSSGKMMDNGIPPGGALPMSAQPNGEPDISARGKGLGEGEDMQGYTELTRIQQ